MRTAIERVRECRVCGRSDQVEVMSLAPAPLANAFLADVPDTAEQRYPLEICVCPGCWLMSLRHVVAPEVLFRHYLYISPDSVTMTRHMRRLADRCVDRLSLAGDDLVVELGSNVGSQLEIFRLRGMRVLGVDPAANLAAIAEERAIPTLPEFFTAASGSRIASGAGRARLILGRHVFAHVDDLADLLKGVRTLLSPDGLFVIEVPYLLDLLDGNQFDTIYHEHLSYFSVRTLSTLFTRHGFRVVDVERGSVHGGSIVVYAAPAHTAPPVGRAVADLLDLEERSGLGDMRRYTRFAGDVERIKEAVGDLVRGLAAGGEVVAGYGAPAKGVMLLNACGLGRKDVIFCSDTTPLKQGRLLPGSRIPVLSPEQAGRACPGSYLLLAWNYADEVIQREHRFLARGGRFIVPLPEPRMVAGTRGGTAPA